MNLSLQRVLSAGINLKIFCLKHARTLHGFRHCCSVYSHLPLASSRPFYPLILLQKLVPCSLITWENLFITAHNFSLPESVVEINIKLKQKHFLYHTNPGQFSICQIGFLPCLLKASPITVHCGYLSLFQHFFLSHISIYGPSVLPKKMIIISDLSLIIFTALCIASSLFLTLAVLQIFSCDYSSQSPCF